MEKIRAYVDWNDYTHQHLYREFEILEYLPKIDEYFKSGMIVDVEDVKLDCEQPSNDVYNYRYFKLVVADEEDEDEKEDYYVAVEYVEI